MLHPNRECREGRHHVTTDVRADIRRCVWCGVPIRTRGNPDEAAPKLAAHVETPTPRVVPIDVSPNAMMIREIETRFSAQAREYAANSPMLRHWVQQGNKLPAVYL